MVDAGLTVMVALVSPFHAPEAIGEAAAVGWGVHRGVVEPRSRSASGAIRRGCRQGRGGKLKGLHLARQSLQRPRKPELRIDTSVISVEASVELVLRRLG